MDEQAKKAFDFAADLTKQMITLSASIVTVTLLFSDKIPRHNQWAKFAWVFFLFSVLAGVWTLMALTGSVAANDSNSGRGALGSNIRIPAGVQICCFGIAALLTLCFVITTY